MLGSNDERLIIGDDIHLWIIRLVQPIEDLASLAALLAPDELARADRLASPHLRAASVARRAYLRLLIARYTQTLPAKLRLSYTEHGKPFLADYSLSFNASHSGSLCACAFAVGTELGVDIEEVREIAELSSLVKNVFAAEELSAWQALSPEQRLPAFYRCWTRKEALLKATGEGLSRDMTSFALACGDAVEQEFAQLACATGDKCWRILQFEPAANFAGALVYKGLGRQIIYHQTMASSCSPVSVEKAVRPDCVTNF